MILIFFFLHIYWYHFKRNFNIVQPLHFSSFMYITFDSLSVFWNFFFRIGNSNWIDFRYVPILELVEFLYHLAIKGPFFIWVQVFYKNLCTISVPFSSFMYITFDSFKVWSERYFIFSRYVINHVQILFTFSATNETKSPFWKYG